MPYSLNFKFPIDFSDRKLYLDLKGNVGGERANLVLRDVDNKTYRVNDICLASNWRSEEIKFGDMKKSMDMSRIIHMRIECGYIGESSEKLNSLIDYTIYIKNIELRKEGF